MLSRFHTLLRIRLQELIDSRSTSVIDGSVQDYASYKYHVGYIAGLRDALILCDDVEREMSGDSSKTGQGD